MNENKHITKQKILNWYCREGSKGIFPNCDTHCPNKQGENPCINYQILQDMLNQWEKFREKNNVQ